MDCIFCKIVEGKLPSSKVYEDDKVLAFNDIAPMAPTHILFVPKKHFDSLAHVAESESEVMHDIFKAVMKVTHDRGIAKDGYRVAINTGAKGGQVVFHLHVHVLAGKKMSAQMT